MGELRLSDVRLGREICDAGDLPRHRHGEGYLTLVLKGVYLEAGDAGRFRVREGDVLVHRPFEAHQDLFGAGPAEVLNLPLPPILPPAAILRVADPDAVVQLALKDAAGAAALACGSASEAEAEQDWPDLLADALRRPQAIQVGEWARCHGIAPATASRGFRQAYGTTPARYRAEARTRLALERICASSQPMIDVAFELGFADQAHMTRSLSEMTGRSPRCWRQADQTDSRR